ncbi:hypothetical protein AMTR_s00043p00041380, partial [Amborella trichopoda]
VPTSSTASSTATASATSSPLMAVKTVPNTSLATTLWASGIAFVPCFAPVTSFFDQSLPESHHFLGNITGSTNLFLFYRKVTVEDTARKHSMELRLLHSAAYAHPWFSQWGYSFCHGSFCITELRYSMAVKILNQLPLAMLDPQHQDAHLHRIIGKYKTICNSTISTLGQLLRAMLLLNACLPWQKANAAPTMNGSQLVTPSKCMLKKLDNNKVEVRDRARKHIGETGLLDFVLMSLNNCTVGPHLIRRTINRKTKVLEYSLSLVSTELDYCDGEAATKTRKSKSGDHPQNQIQVGRSEVMRDLEYVYKRVLEGGLGGEVVEAARRVVLDTKHLTKEWPISDDDGKLRFMVRMVVEEAGMFSHATTPPELVVLSLHASVGDLRAEAERTLHDTYCVMEGFVAQDLIWPHGLVVSEMELLFRVSRG